MPAPDPAGVDIEEHDDGGFRITCEVWEDGNRRHRLARMRAVARKVRFGGWRCRRCSRPVPFYKRADALFCSERCRKAEARVRREHRRQARWAAP